jgi:DNA-binding IclR family transcriptional regulator
MAATPATNRDEPRPTTGEVPAAGGDGGLRRTAAGRVLALLDAFGPGHRKLSLSEISRRAELTLPTAHRLARELVAWGALERDADGCYSVGLRLLELSALAPRGLALREAAFPHLDDLHQATRGHVHLGVRDGVEVVYVETLPAPASALISSRVGDRWPMHATGTGLVLLAYADRELQELVLRSPLERYTRMTVVDPGELRRKLAEIRQTGVAVAYGQITLPDMVVAVPIQGAGGEVIAAISIVVRSEIARPRALAAALAETSRAISATLGRRPRVPGGGKQPVRPHHRAGSMPR